MKPSDTKNFQGKKLVVLGGGESGVGAAILGQKIGMEVLLSDAGKLKDSYRSELEKRNIPFEEGAHSEVKILDADYVVKSPGIPDKAPLVKKLREKGVEIVSEIEFAGWFTDAKMICITGSNGKTTTTSLIYHIFREAGENAGLAGNIGKSLAWQVAEDPKPLYVIELSSFQLDGMYRFKADIAVLLNITPDHLDRYEYKMDNYVDSKLRILQNQTEADYYIYWEEDPEIEKGMQRHQPTAISLPFSSKKLSGSQAWIDGDNVIVCLRYGKQMTMLRKDIPIKGLHNMYNTMAAVLACDAYGLDEQKIRQGVTTFIPVEHRLELVAVKDGVRWINDSKATNVASTYYALESMDTPTVLILGGTDKGNDYSEILPFVQQKVKAIVCMGVDNDKLMNFFRGKVSELYDTHSLAEAVDKCRETASEGDTVLLSPCCASFDLFKNYEHRGQLFKEAVRNL